MNYKYSPLSATSRGTFSIRLLHLMPTCDSPADGSLSCRLVETKIVDRSLDTFVHDKREEAHVKYQALSYTWGLPLFTHSLYVLDNNDDDDTLIPPSSSSSEICITENLCTALHSLRKQTETLVLWADAPSCHFTKTYAGASSVLVWLGPDDVLNHGKLCLDFFTNLAALILEDPNSESENDQRSWRKRFRINQAVSAFLGDDELQPRAITSLLQRSWFKRRATSIHWNAFELALVELFEDDKGGFSGDHRTILRTMSRIRNADAMLKRQTPLDTLVEFDSFECSNPRDRLYALYGVMQHWFPNSAGIQVLVENINYGLHIRDIFTDFAVLMMKLRDDFPLDSNYNSTTHVPQLAAAMRPTLQREVTGQNRGVPSWVPDWTGTMCHKPLHHSPETHDLIKAVITLDILPLTGAVHKAKHALNNFLCSTATSLDQIGFFSSGRTDIYGPTGQHTISAIAVSLVANWEHTPANSYFAQDARFPAQLLEQLRSSRHHLPEILHKWPAYVELITITMRGRSLMLTESGYVGMCDTNARAGDVVCILSDTRIPFILRPKSLASKATAKSCSSLTDGGIPTEDAFELLGDAYVHALMNGEGAESLGERLKTSLRRLCIL
ncbi:HET domain-containing protein [Trichoderma compactum]